MMYRRPTRNEALANSWGGEVLLVSLEPSFVDAVARGGQAPKAVLPLRNANPASDQVGLPTVTENLKLVGTRSWVGAVGLQVRSSSSTGYSSQPSVFIYKTSGLDWDSVGSSAVQVLATKDGGVAILGATPGRTYWARGPLPSATLDVPLPVGRELFLLTTQNGSGPTGELLTRVPSLDVDVAKLVADGEPVGFAGLPSPEEGHVPGVIHQCTDGLNNDPQLGYDADGCDFSCLPHPDFGTDLFPGVNPVWEYGNPFHVTADIEWCTIHADTWQLDLEQIGLVTEQFLNWVQAPPEYPGPRVPPFRLVGVSCLPAELSGVPDLAAATACHDDGVCFGDFADYAFAGLGGHWHDDNDGLDDPSLLHNVWTVADQWADGAVADGSPEMAHPIKFIGLVTVHDCETCNTLGAAGQALLPPVVPDQFAGGGVVRGLWDFDPGGAPEDWAPGSPALVGRNLAHEFGHTLGLDHDGAVVPGLSCVSGASPGCGFMQPTGGLAPWLSESDSLLSCGVGMCNQWEAWTIAAPQKDFPRPPGFKYVGCDVSGCPPELDCKERGSGTAWICQ